MKTCIDTNVLLEVLLEGRKNAHIAMQYLSRVEDGAISALSAHLYVYFGRKEGHPLASLLKDLESYRITAIDEHVVGWATVNVRDDDFEDALQVGSALIDGCDTFVTFDSNLAKTYNNLPTLKIVLLK